jgi:ABC-2 type transport system ATP-binding protein
VSSTSTTRSTVAVEAHGLTVRYGRRSAAALDDCSFRLPAGRVSALVGPNGAGKSTLLATAAGLLRPAAGTLTVFGTSPAGAREDIAYLSQSKPLYPNLTIAETLRLGAELNPARWDAPYAAAIVEQGSLDPGTRVRRLSGGQRTRVALALALGKRPDLMLLDEPMADLDPLARHELLGTLMADAAERGTTVLISSHIVAELADACDHLLLLGGGRIRLGGGLDDLLLAHTVVTGRGTPADLAPHLVVESRAAGRGLTALIRNDGPVDDRWQTGRPSLEELILAHLRSPSAPALLAPGTTATPETVTR